jgi:ADP-ribosylglycohydrolase
MKKETTPAIQLFSERAHVAAGQERILHVVVRIVSPEPPAHLPSRPPLNLGLVFDRSGSMAGEKIARAREAAMYCVDQMLPSDRMSLVVFDDRITTLARSQHVADARRLKDAISRVEAEGSTALFDAWREGAREVSADVAGHGINRVILLTDGQANVGETRPQAFIRSAAEAARHGVSTSTLGIGSDFNEELLIPMAEAGCGHAYFVSSAEELPAIFAQELEGLAAQFAEKVSLELEPGPGVEIVEVLNELPMVPGTGGYALPGLSYGETTDVVVRLRVPSAEEGEALTLLTARLSWSPGGGERRAVEGSFVTTFAAPDAVADEPVDPEAIKAVEILLAAQAKSEAVRIMDEGDVGTARRMIRDARTRLATRLAGFDADPRVHAERSALGRLEDELEQPHLRQVTRKRMRYEAHGAARSRSFPSEGSHGHTPSRRETEMTSRELFEDLAARGALRLRRSELFDADPGAPLGSFDPDRVEGMLLGLAVGDSLGNTSESMRPVHRRARHGEIRDYLYNRHAGAAVGLPSDDTQLTFWALEQINADQAFVPERVAARLQRGKIFGIGSTMRDYLRCAKQGDRPWYACGQESAGNGAIMRIAPALVPHLANPGADLWMDAAILGAITHNDSASNASCVAFVGMLWELLAMHEAPPAEWWLGSFVDRARQVECHEGYRARGGRYSGYEGSLSRFLSEAVGEAHVRGLSTVEACDGWHSGAYLLETVPSALYILMRHGHDPEEAIVRAVNDTWDNDTVAAIVGAAVGALHGRKALPDRWIAGLLGRTGAADDGRVFELIRETTCLWLPGQLA